MMDYKKYPKNWKEISKRIRYERAGNKCEWCGAPNGDLIYRYSAKQGDWSLAEDGLIDERYTEGYEPRLTKVVLTVAHLGVPYPDGRLGSKANKMDVREENLAALCNKCHLDFDQDEHKANRRNNRKAKKLAAGQLAMF